LAKFIEVKEKFKAHKIELYEKLNAKIATVDVEI